MTDQGRNKIPWPRMALEGAVIVMSILLAFSIDALWEKRGEFQEESAVIINLESEFSAGVEALENVVSILGRREDSAKLLLELSRNMDGGPPDNVLTELSRVFLSKTTLNLPNGALESYLASGNSDLIQNSELRIFLASWTSYINELKEEEIVTTQLIETELRPFLMSRVELGPIYSAHPGNIFGDFPSSEINMVSLREIIAEPIFANLVTTRLARIRIEQREIDNLQIRASEILRLLRQEAD